MYAHAPSNDELPLQSVEMQRRTAKSPNPAFVGELQLRQTIERRSYSEELEQLEVQTVNETRTSRGSVLV